jgi:phosphomannomutase
MKVPGQVFREYDIRGIVGETLDPDLARAVGRAYGSEIGSGTTVAVGHDNRPSSPALASALIEGLNASGVDVVFVQTVPTPALYFATYELETDGGIQITGSHNPPEYNGIKMTVGPRSLYGEAIQALRARIEADELISGAGTVREVDVLDRYAVSSSTAVTAPAASSPRALSAPQVPRWIRSTVNPTAPSRITTRTPRSTRT